MSGSDLTSFSNGMEISIMHLAMVAFLSRPTCLADYCQLIVEPLRRTAGYPTAPSWIAACGIHAQMKMLLKIPSILSTSWM
jgi:hypothetical protein